LTDELVGCEDLEATSEVVDGDEAFEMGSELVMAVIVEALDSRLLDSAVHPLDLIIGPGMLGLCQPVFDAVSLWRRPTP
jgi:F0F1-type ATP synthase assembly protein I